MERASALFPNEIQAFHPHWEGFPLVVLAMLTGTGAVEEYDLIRAASKKKKKSARLKRDGVYSDSGILDLVCDTRSFF